MDLQELIAQFDQHESAIPLTEIEAALYQLDLSCDLSEFTKFSPDRFQRNPVHSGPAYQMVLLCWRAGQSSPIHDHRGSGCGVIVISGTASEQFYEFKEGRAVKGKTRELKTGEVMTSEDTDIHRVWNGDPEKDLVTLHVYSPPLVSMTFYSEEALGTFDPAI